MYGIMLVDDEPAVLKGLADLVDWSALDAEVVASATSGQEALSFLQIAPVHILITDICMPQMDGLALITSAKALNPLLRCIIISAHDEFAYVRQALTLGVENYLLKPINQNELAETLAKTIGNINRTAVLPPAEALAFRTNILDRWANSSIQDFELAERAALLQINLDAREYMALVAVPRAAATLEDRLAQSSALLGGLRHELMDAGLEAELFIDRHASLTAILRSDSKQARHGALSSALGRALAPGHCFAAVGNTVASAYAISTSYRNAYALLPSRFLEDTPFAFYQDSQSAAEYPAVQLQFEQALEECNEPAALEAADRLLARLKGRADETRQCLRPLILRVLSLFNDSMRRSAPVPEPVLLAFRTISHCNSVEQLFDAFSHGLKTALLALRSRQAAMHPAIRRALDLTASAYATDINIKTIADQLNINPSYFGQLFKAETGELFNDYLTSIRLREARNLLAATDLRIGEIIGRIGISQQSYFNRIFKKEFGVTPVEYRRTVKESMNNA
jgi:two-component system, response regulator YesN